jgi:hypothetical protein
VSKVNGLLTVLKFIGLIWVFGASMNANAGGGEQREALGTIEIPPNIVGIYVKKSPTCHWSVDHQECKGFQWDTVEIQKKTTTTTDVSIATSAINEHGCAYQGVGRWNGAALVVTANAERFIPSVRSGENGYSVNDGPICRVTIKIHGDLATYDVDPSTETICHENFCSARGWLSFPEAARPYYHRRK